MGLKIRHKRFTFWSWGFLLFFWWSLVEFVANGGVVYLLIALAEAACFQWETKFEFSFYDPDEVKEEPRE